MQIVSPPIAYDKGLSEVGLARQAGELPAGLSRMLAGARGNGAEIKQAAKELDAYFISYLMKTMRETVPKEGLLSNKHGEQFYYFYDMEIGRLASERGGLGFGAMVLADAAKQQPVDHQKNLSSPGSIVPILGPNR